MQPNSLIPVDGDLPNCADIIRKVWGHHSS
uniref:Uncharacterized protein n=1 Tax=Anguilla anguilla TaxID=7936 RepID=A0A0E9TCM6_ANGAN